MTLSTNTAQWQQLGGLGPPPTRRRWQQGVKDLEIQWLQPLGLSYDDHIRPWVGDSLTMAVMAPDVETVEVVDRQVTVWVLPIQDYDQASSLLNSNQLTLGTPPKKRTYKGVEVRDFQSATGEDYAIAVLDQQLMVFANVSIAINQVIDTFQARNPSVAETPRYAEAMQTLKAGQPFAQVYVNMPAVTNRMIAGGNRQLSTATVDRIKEVQGFGSIVTLESDGIRFKSISWFKPGATQTLEADNNVEGLAKYLPQNTVMMVSGGNFQQVWTDYAKGTAAKLLIPFNPKEWSDNVEESSGISFNDEFLPWMDGEFAGAIVPVQDDDTKDQENPLAQGVGIAVLSKPSDPTAATNALKKLDDTVQERYDFQIAESKVGNKTITTWKIQTGRAVASHGWLDQSTAFLTLGAPITNRLVQTPTPNLTQSDRFRDATRSSLQPNGHLFINVPQVLNLTQNSPLLPKLTPDALNFLQNFEGIGVTAAVNNSWSHRYDIQIKFKQE